MRTEGNVFKKLRTNLLIFYEGERAFLWGKPRPPVRMDRRADPVPARLLEGAGGKGEDY
jgi:hypothetical protein